MTDIPEMLDEIWIMRCAGFWYPVQPSRRCKPEDHGALNDHILSIEDAEGNVLWKRADNVVHFQSGKGKNEGKNN